MAYISPSNADLGQFSESSDGYRRTQDRADFDPTSPEVRLTRGELKELSKTGGVPIVYGTRQVTGITVYLEERTGVNAGDWQQSIVICEGEIAEVNLLMVNDGGWLLPGNDDVYDRIDKRFVIGPFEDAEKIAFQESRHPNSHEHSIMAEHLYNKIISLVKY